MIVKKLSLVVDQTLNMKNKSNRIQL